MTISDAMHAERNGRPWRIRLVYQGENRANASGRSDKWWEASGQGRPYVSLDAMTRWGATGKAGQSKPATSDDAYKRANEKLRKGYVYDHDVRVQAPPPPASLQDLVNRATWRPATAQRVLMLAAEEGFVALALDIEARLRVDARADEVVVKPYLAENGAIWGLAANADNFYFAKIR